MAPYDLQLLVGTDKAEAILVITSADFGPCVTQELELKTVAHARENGG
jgi:hypothetical protein